MGVSRWYIGPGVYSPQPSTFNVTGPGGGRDANTMEYALTNDVVLCPHEGQWWNTIYVQTGLCHSSSLLPPATKLGQGNIFRSVCQEFCSHPAAVHAGRYRQQAGGTHPTGMHT